MYHSFEVKNYCNPSGNEALLSYNVTWKKLIQYYRNNGCVVDGKDFPLRP